MLDDLCDQIEKAFADVFIDLAHVQRVQLKHPHTFAIIDGDGNGAYAFLKVIHGGAWPQLKRKPFHLMITLVKHCAKLDKLLNFQPAQVAPGLTPDWTSQDTTASAVLDFDTEVWKLTFTLPGTLLTVLDADSLNHVAAARSLPAFAFEDSFTKFTIDHGNGAEDVLAHKAKITRNGERFDVTLDGPLQRYSEALLEGKELDFVFDLEVLKLDAAGLTSGNSIFVQTHERQNGGWRRADSQDIAKTLIHEIGHALGLVPAGLQIKGKTWAHPYFYENRGGVGRHCSKNAKSDSRMQGDNAPFIHDDGPMCVMFHQIHAQAGPAFCEDCHRCLKLMPLDHATLGRKGWNTFTS